VEKYHPYLIGNASFISWFITDLAICFLKRVFWLFLLLQACATPSEQFHSTAADYHFSSTIINTSKFSHRLYINKAALANQNMRLHVYLDGDGTPWYRKKWIAKDPTSRNPLILDLMSMDDQPAILLGRPCYHNIDHKKSCHSKWWTSHRYAAEVVNSMVTALRYWLQDKAYQKLVLIGYSGGGSLAVLMAPYLEQVDVVVTLAANLDVAAWSYFHGYQTLSDSLDPADNPPLPISVCQLHIAGGRDAIVPPFIIEKYVEKQTHADFMVIPGVKHNGNWTKFWPDILKRLKKTENKFYNCR